MSVRVVVGAMAIGLLAGGAAYAGSPCDGSAAQSYRESARVVDSLRPDKAGQMRVFAVDGSEFTAGQAMWMKGQLRKVARLCASDSASDRAEAARLLTEVDDLLRSHHRDS
jgi:hypothetical protein